MLFYPKIEKAKVGLKKGYSREYVKKYGMLCAELSYKRNSAHWLHLHRDEILKLIPEGEDMKKFFYFGRSVEAASRYTNTNHMQEILKKIDWVGLTPNDIADAYANVTDPYEPFAQMARLIEAKLKEKNHAN